MKTEKLKLSDGSYITKYVPESAEDVAKIVADAKLDPSKWDFGDSRPAEPAPSE